MKLCRKLISLLAIIIIFSSCDDELKPTEPEEETEDSTAFSIQSSEQLSKTFQAEADSLNIEEHFVVAVKL